MSEILKKGNIMVVHFHIHMEKPHNKEGNCTYKDMFPGGKWCFSPADTVFESKGNGHTHDEKKPGKDQV